MAERRALVTGGAGFIGSHVAEALLAAGWRVRVMDDLSVGTRTNLPGDVEFIEGDIRNAQAALDSCEGIDTVFHFAARVSVRGSMKDFVEDADTNVAGTLALLRAASQCHVRRFVFASSMAVYTDSTDRVPLPESSSTVPISPYGVGKLAVERYLDILCPSLGMAPIVLRIFNTYGPRQVCSAEVGVLTLFIHRLLLGEPCTILGDGRQCRDYVHVADVAEAVCRAADAPQASQGPINLGSGEGTTLLEIRDLLQHALGRGEFVHAAAVPGEIGYSVADISRARAILGYAPRHRLLDELPALIEHIRSSINS